MSPPAATQTREAPPSSWHHSQPHAQPRPEPLSHIVLDAEHFERAMGMVLDRLEAMQGQQAEAIAEGIRAVIFDPATFDKLAAAVSNHAAARARDRIGGGVLWLARRFAVVTVIAVAAFFFIAKVAGWEVAAKAAKVITEVLQ